MELGIEAWEGGHSVSRAYLSRFVKHSKRSTSWLIDVVRVFACLLLDCAQRSLQGPLTSEH